MRDAYNTYTYYGYDTLGNLTSVSAAKDGSGNNLLGSTIATTMTYDSLSNKRSMTDPDMGSWSYAYDKNSNLLTQTDAKGQITSFVYDPINRVSQKSYGTSSTVYYTYDDTQVAYSKGKQTKVSYQPTGQDLREDSVLGYDLFQNVITGQKKIGSNAVVIDKWYDSAGRVLSQRHTFGSPPTQLRYNYEYDVAGNLLYIQDNSTLNYLVQYSNFTARGQQTLASFPKPNNVNVATGYSYTPTTGRLSALATQKYVNGVPSGGPYQYLSYQFDGKGNLTSQVDTRNSITHAYTYDYLDRLSTATGTGTNSYSQSYTYDVIGNITYKSDVGTYSYNYASKPHAVTSAGSFSFTYDANGNMTQRTGGGDTITISSANWNYENKPTLIQKGSNTTTLIYDGNGDRVEKISSLTGTTLYFGDSCEIRGGVWTIHLFANTSRVASVLSGGTIQFYHADHIGSASFITDQNGNPKEQIVYFPFGAYRAVGNVNGTYDYDTNFPDVFYTFTGQEDDDDLGLYNYGARLYDSVLGRFISADSMVTNPSNPQSLNRYSYALNNPLRYIDPSGNFDFDTADFSSLSSYDLTYGYFDFSNYSNLSYYNSNSLNRYSLNCYTDFSSGLTGMSSFTNSSLIWSGSSNLDTSSRFSLSNTNDFSFGSNRGAYAGFGTLETTHLIFSGMDYTNEFFTGYSRSLQSIGKFAYYGENGVKEYSLLFKGNQYIDSTFISAAKANQAELAAIGRTVTRASLALSVGMTTYELGNSGLSNKSAVKALADYGMAGAAAFGGPVGVTVALTYSVLNVTGVLNPLWDMFNDKRWSWSW